MHYGPGIKITMDYWTDGWMSYRDYAGIHGLCNAHHPRELTFLAENPQQTWPSKRIDFLLRAKGMPMPPSGPKAPWPLSRSRRCAANTKPSWPKARRTTRGSPAPKSSSVAVSGNLPRPIACCVSVGTPDAVLRFLTDTRGPFDNNLAERDIRMPKLKQQTSGCFRTVTGAQSFCTIRSYLATLRKQGRDVFHALTLAFQGSPPNPLPSR